MSFREENAAYTRLKVDWEEIVDRAHIQGKGTRTDELDNLMLSSYRLCRCIRSYLRSGATETYGNVRVPLLPEALRVAKDTVIRRKGDRGGLPSLFHEADCLEALSRAAYRWLKDNKKLVRVKQ